MVPRGDVMGWLTGMGSSPFLGVDVPAWAWSNLLQAQRFVVQHPAGSQVQSEVVDFTLGRLLSQCVMLAMLAITLLFFVMHNYVLLRTSNVYKALPLEQQLVTCQHAVHAVAYSLTILPQTWLACELLFKAWTGDDLVKRTSSILIALAMGRAVLFTVEACVRSVKWSWLLFLHHALVMLVTSINLWDCSPVLVALSTVLDLFAAHELPLYVALLAYRLKFWSRNTTRAFLRASCAWYVVTRLLQTSILAYMLSHHLAVPSIRSSPAFITIAILSAAFTAFQAFTLFIYQGMDQKLRQDEARSSSSSSKAGLPDDETLRRDASQQHQHVSQLGAGLRRCKARRSPMRASDGAQLKDQCGVW